MSDDPYPGTPSAASVREVAAAILAESPPCPGWPARGRAVPRKRWVALLRESGWPAATVDAMLPQIEHTGLRAGQRTGDAIQPVAVVPETWLRLLAERLGADWGYACRWTLPDE